MKKIYAITFFSALLVLGNENNILANSNLSSLETNDLIVTETIIQHLKKLKWKVESL